MRNLRLVSKAKKRRCVRYFYAGTTGTVSGASTQFSGVFASNKKPSDVYDEIVKFKANELALPVVLLAMNALK